MFILFIYACLFALPSVGMGYGCRYGYPRVMTFIVLVYLTNNIPLLLLLSVLDCDS